MFTSQWVWTLQGEKQRVRLASRVWYPNSRACGWHSPHPPQSTGPQGTGLAWIRLCCQLVPAPPAGGCRQDRTMGQEPTPGLSRPRNPEDRLEATTALLLGAANPEERPHWAPGEGRSLSRPSATNWTKFRVVGAAPPGWTGQGARPRAATGSGGPGAVPVGVASWVPAAASGPPASHRREEGGRHERSSKDTALPWACPLTTALFPEGPSG